MTTPTKKPNKKQAPKASLPELNSNHSSSTDVAPSELRSGSFGTPLIARGLGDRSPDGKVPFDLVFTPEGGEPYAAVAYRPFQTFTSSPRQTGKK